MAFNILDLSDEILVLIAESCLADVQSLSALAASCSSLFHLIHHHQPFWKLAIRSYFKINDDILSQSAINYRNSFKNLWQLKFRNDFFKFDPFMLEIPSTLNAGIMNRSGHSTHMVSQDKVLVVGGAGTRWVTHDDVLELTLDYESQKVAVNQICCTELLEMPWLAWSHYDPKLSRLLVATGDLSELHHIELDKKKSSSSALSVVQGRPEVSAVLGAAQVPLDNPNEFLLIGGRYANIQATISTVYHVSVSDDDVRTEAIFPILSGEKPLPFSIPRHWLQSHRGFRPRWCPAAVRINSHQVLIFGGWEDFDRSFLNDVKIFDLSTNEMKDIPCMGDAPPPRCQVGAFTLCDGRYFVAYGGAYRKQRIEANEDEIQAYGDIVRDVPDIYVLDLTLQYWIKSPCQGPVSSVHTCNVIDENRVLIVGGMHSDPGAEFPTFHDSVQLLTLRNLYK